MAGNGASAGFTMLEALVAVVLMGLVLGALASVTGQWLPNWNRGLARVQRNEQVATALDRLVADLSSAVLVARNREDTRVLFEGNEIGVTFVRSSIGPNTGPGLDIVRIGETGDSRGRVMVRQSARFAPLPSGDRALATVSFSDPVVLLRAPYRVVLAYAGFDGVWRNAWREPHALPAAVRFSVIDGATDRLLGVATATRVHVEIAAIAPEPADDAEAAEAASSTTRARNGAQRP